jgi:DNA-binding NtrC family response regulator
MLDAVKNYDVDIPVIMMTAYGTIETAEEALRKGAFDFITKPFRKEQILFTIEKALSWLRLQRENKNLKDKLGS